MAKSGLGGEQLNIDLEADPDQLDIYILCDTTGSMGDYVSSLTATIIQMSNVVRLLLHDRARIAVVSYKDYSDGAAVCTYVPLGSTRKSIVAFVEALYASGGGDAPEATKTGLNKIAEMIRANDNGRAKSFVIHYTDAPPHCEDSQSQESNKKGEIKALKSKDPGYDWVRICRFFGSRNIPIYTFLTADSQGLTKSLMLHLGRVVLMRDKSSYNVTKATMGMLMHIFGQKFDYDEDFTMLGCDNDFATGLGFRCLCPRSPTMKHNPDCPWVEGTVTHLDLALNEYVLNETRDGGFNCDGLSLSKKVPFSFPTIGIRINLHEILKKLKTDLAFQTMVFEIFDELFTPDCCLCLTYNPILGKLWRKVCTMRDNYRLKVLQYKLSQAMDRITDDKKWKQMREWLDESYNCEEEIAELMSEPKSYKGGQIEHFPCLILDPTRCALKDYDSTTITQGLRSLARAPTQSGLAIAQGVMTSLVLIEHPSPSFKLPTFSDSPRFLPMSLYPDLFFSCLPHLGSPGMKFSLRASAMIAVVAFLSGNKYLKDKAEAFLEANKGQWINLDDVTKFPEALSPETVKLLHRVPQFLTEQENDVYAKLFQICRLRLAFDKEFPVNLPQAHDVKTMYRDYRFQCVSCQWYRSFTIMTPDGNCGLCVFKHKNPYCMMEINAYKMTKNNPNLFDPTFNPACVEPGTWSKNANFHFSQTGEELLPREMLEKDQNMDEDDDDDDDAMEAAPIDAATEKDAGNDDASTMPKSDVDDETIQSRLAYCRNPNCLCIYEVIMHKKLKGQPKCHYCRTGWLAEEVPHVTCGSCSNKYVLPDPSLLKKMKKNSKGEWVCAICVHEQRLSFQEVSSPLREILQSNPHLMEIFNLSEETFEVINGMKSLYKIFMESWAAITAAAPSSKKEAAPLMTLFKAFKSGLPFAGPKRNEGVFLKGRKVFGVDGLKEKIKKVVEEGDLTEMCNLCCEDKLIPHFKASPCGNCKNKICKVCLRTWVNQIQPGKVVFPSNLVCPFCKMVPKENIYIQYNRPAKSLLHKEHLKSMHGRMDPSLYYGWCKGCSKIKEICPIECGGEDVPFSTSDDFTCESCTNATVTIDVPKCPGCDAPTLKAYGCNHIQCTRCNTHWCYVCQEKFDQYEIYDHLTEVHGGYSEGAPRTMIR